MTDTASDLLRLLENDTRKADDRAYGFEGKTLDEMRRDYEQVLRARNGPPAPVFRQGMLPIREQIGDEFSRMMNPKALWADGVEKARGFMQDRISEDALLRALFGSPPMPAANPLRQHINGMLPPKRDNLQGMPPPMIGVRG